MASSAGGIMASPEEAERLAAVEKKLAMTSGGNAAFKNYNNQFAHIADPTERRRLALAEIDNVPFGWYHVRTIAIGGIGFMTDSYDIFAVGLITGLLGIVYYGGTLSSDDDTALKVSTSTGTMAGQIGFGIIADYLGRKKIYGFELLIIICTTLVQALSAGSPGVSIIGVLVFWRIIMGIGIGGDYPLSATITSEFATTKWRGLMMNAVFAMQGIGQLCAALVLLITTAAFKSQLEMASSPAACSANGACVAAADRMWRIIIGFGAVPGSIALYFRLTIPETPRYTFDVEKDAEKANALLHGSTEEPAEPPKASRAEFVRHYKQWKNLKVLLGCALSWFFLDIAFYGLGLNNPIILNAIGWSGGGNMYHIMHNTAMGNLVLVLAGAVPGYWVSAGIIDTVGRKPVQLFGFFALTLIFFVIGFKFWDLSGNELLALYTIAQFFFNCGPNSTTFVIPGEVFPTKYRSTSHGISAASGKLGAIIAQVVFGPLKSIGADKERAKADPRWLYPWINHIMQIFACIMALGFFTTLLIPETARKTLEELGGMDEPTDAIPKSDSSPDVVPATEAEASKKPAGQEGTS
ncbi:hypothetical protein RB599_008378 [Gaeumannomyces hyphopodioides]